MIVGPTHSQTASFLERGEQIARTAEAQGMDVRRVFHPRATYANVLSQAQGASLLVYLGHGNGWPSPYAAFQTDTKDGFGLNPYEGGSESSVKYYGEGPISRDIRLAANSVVLLNHLCYASGNSEPGKAAPTVAVAKERVDNFAAGFLRAGAGAVFALGYQSGSDIVRGLYSSNGTMDQIFMGVGYKGGRDIRFASVRTSGASVHMDPDGTSNGYLRAVSGNLSMTAQSFRGPTIGSHLVAPTLFHPADGDKLASTSSYSLRLRHSATVNWSITDARGRLVLTRWSNLARTAGSYAWRWDGRNASGGFVPQGRYVSVVTAVTPSATVTDKRWFSVGAFRISTSVRSAAPGQDVTVTLTSAEPLTTTPVLRVAQPGVAAYTVETTQIGATTFRATVTIRAGGSAGTAELRATGTDTNGQTQSSFGSLTIT
ncbi:MAG: hypothetical protein H0X16_00655 [Chloroflexi bacterium]|nr:hypothetical protein [Chloroflexota bacterium]